MTLTQQLAAYSEWRAHLSAGLENFRNCLTENDLSDAQIELRMTQLIEKLHEDKLHVAFVAEFSRGKSELINAIFFADYGNRMLPSTAGRTTMCPTELLYDAGKPPSIELLPIQTRQASSSITEYKRYPEEWQTIPLDIHSPDSLKEALRSVSEVERVTPEFADKLGFSTSEKESVMARLADDGMVEIPRWRHAIINFPHPLLQQGLVILDTPGLNAIGTEPELTLSLLPNAHAVLFVLAADTGVTQSDLTIWNEHIGTPGGRKKGRLVVLNKIDGLWDDLKSEEEINAEISKQVDSCAWTLDLPANQIFPVSAQKALIGKINDDAGLLTRSRLPDLEAALSEELIPAKQEIVQENTRAEFLDIYTRMRELLESRLSGLREQLAELTELRGKNKGVVQYMMGKVRVEKEEFESGLQRYYAVRSVFSQLTNNLFGHLGLDALRLLTASTREAMLAATFSKSLSLAMKNYFNVARANLAKSEHEIGEILSMMEAIYRKFSVEHGLKLGTPTVFSLIRYREETERLEYWCNTHLNTTFKLMTSEKKKVTQRFFEEVATQVRRSFERANRDAELWLKAVMAPMEIQIREHQIQLKHRLESIKRIHQATDTLEDRINELLHVESTLVSQTQAIAKLGQQVQILLSQPIEQQGLLSAA
ncbi:MAG: dynamin family protein [Betaproteobacteria bacterium]